MDDPATEGVKALQESAKAVQAVAKVSGQAIDGTGRVLGYLAHLLGDSLEQAAGILCDKLRYARWERRVRLLERAKTLALEHGLREPTRIVPTTLLLPLLEVGSLEENNDLQDMWARMIVNASDVSSNVDLRRCYISILSDCTLLDIRIMATLYNAEIEMPGTRIYGALLPEQAISVDPTNKISRELSVGLKRSLGNLRRLGLLAGDTWAASGDAELAFVIITELGMGLVAACTLRDRVEPGE